MTAGAGMEWKTLARYHQLTELVKKEPGNPLLWVEYGKSRNFRKQPAAALAAFREAVRLAPDEPALQLILAKELGSYTAYNRMAKKVFDPDELAREALALFERLASVPETAVDARIGMINPLIRLGNIEAALEMCREVAKSHPEKSMDLWDTWLSMIPQDYPGVGEIAEITLAGDIPPELRVKIMLGSSICVHDDDSLEKQYARVQKNLSILEKEEIRFPAVYHVAEPYSAYPLHFHSGNTLPYRRRLNDFFAKSCPELNYVSPLVAKRLAGPEPKRLRLGILTTRTWDVDFGSMLTGLVGNLDRERYEVVLFYNDTSVDENPYSIALKKMVDEQLLYTMNNWVNTCRVIAEAQVDILLHETVFSSATFIGCARLAPVQCSILDKLMSFASAHQDYVVLMGNRERLPALAAHYNEKLALFPTPVTVPDPERGKPAPVNRTEFGLPSDARFVINWQPLLRWLPVDDSIIFDLLRRNPDLWFLARHESGMPTQIIEDRWRKHGYDELRDRIRFFPFMPLDVLLGMMKQASCIIPSPHDSGLLSIPTAIGMDCPYPAFRGIRHYHHFAELYNELLGTEELIANDRNEYLEILHRLVNDGEWKAGIVEKIRRNKHRVFDFHTHVGEFQMFMEAAYRRARRGLPPMHWCDGGFVDIP